MTTFLSKAPLTIAVLCEGETEETFIKRLLAPHFMETQKILKPHLLQGLSRYGYPDLASDIRKYLRRGDIQYVTTLIDLYGLPKNFPGRDRAPSDPYEKVRFLEEAFASDIKNERFIPYIMLHEFEALILVEAALEKFKEMAKVPSNNSEWKQLQKDLERADRNPELINEGGNTHPSHRLQKIWQRYQKTANGIEILESVGLGALREACRHFNEWIEKLEKLSLR